jgi:hypothetical protein
MVIMWGWLLFHPDRKKLIKNKVSLERLLKNKFDRYLLGFGEDEEGAKIYGKRGSHSLN